MTNSAAQQCLFHRLKHIGLQMICLDRDRQAVRQGLRSLSRSDMLEHWVSFSGGVDIRLPSAKARAWLDQGLLLYRICCLFVHHTRDLYVMVCIMWHRWECIGDKVRNTTKPNKIGDLLKIRCDFFQLLEGGSCLLGHLLRQQNVPFCLLYL
jgi:hypothetical protein